MKRLSNAQMARINGGDNCSDIMNAIIVCTALVQVEAVAFLTGVYIGAGCMRQKT
jgi:hypothetical protein